MRDFRECTPQEGAVRLISLVSHLTLVREDEPDSPLFLLGRSAEAMLRGDCMGVYALYHKMCASLISSPARRISGDMLMDHLIWLSVEREHGFALLAARGELEEAMLCAFRSDLAALGELASLDWRDIYRMCAERYRELQLKPRYARDDISVMSSAAWTGTEPKPMPPKDAKLPGEAPPLPPPPEGEWLPLSYGEGGLAGEYAADEALEEIYSRLMRSPDWRGQAEDIWNLFAAYGSGPFLKNRVFRYSNGSLEPMAFGENYVPLSIHDRARQTLCEHIIAFMRGGAATPLLIYGPWGTGKSALARSMADEFPELRLVLINAGAAEGRCDIEPLLRRLGDQPLRFMLLLDGADMNAESFRPLLCACTGGALPQNVLSVATTRAVGENQPFPVKIGLEWPKLSQFADAVSELIEGEAPQLAIDAAWIRNAAVDYQVDARECLTLPAARLIASRYRAAHE